MAENIFDRIMAKYSIFTKSELKVADFILAHRSEVQYMTISELGKACSVAEATLTRFGKSLSCKGLNDLKLAIAQAAVPESVESAYLCYGDVLPEDSIEQKCQKLLGRSMETLRQTIDLLDVKEVQKAVDYLQKASSVYCFGHGNSSIISMEAWGRFAIVTPKFHWVSDSHMQAVSASLLNKDDVILYFSYSGSTRASMEILGLVRKHHLRMVLVTRFANSPAAEHADAVILCDSNESPLQHGSISAKMAQLFIIDLLFNEFCGRNLDLTIENRKKAADAISSKLL